MFALQDNIHDTLRPLPLVYLSISVSTVPPPRMPLGDDMEIDPEPNKQLRRDAEQLEEFLASSIAELPGKLATAIPSLRFVTITVGDANETTLLASPIDWDTADPGIPRPLVSSTRPLARQNIPARYWQVVSEGGNGSSRGLLELSASEGERIRTLADDAIRLVNTI